MFFKKKLMQNNTKKTQIERTEQEDNIPDALSGVMVDTAIKTVGAVSEIATGIFEQLLMGEANEKKTTPVKPNQHIEAPQIMSEKTLFNFGEIENRRQINEIQQLIETIKKEVESIKNAGSSLVSEVADIEKITLNSMPEKLGVYHVRFLELILKILQSIKLKINESGTWLEAMRSKRAKRGSAFMANSKKKGTQYSMSQELTLTRSVQ